MNFSLISGLGSQDEVRLVDHLFDGYNALIRPVENLTETVTVRFGLAMIQLISVVRIQLVLFISIYIQIIYKYILSAFITARLMFWDRRKICLIWVNPATMYLLPSETVIGALMLVFQFSIIYCWWVFMIAIICLWISFLSFMTFKKSSYIYYLTINKILYINWSLAQLLPPPHKTRCVDCVYFIWIVNVLNPLKCSYLLNIQT